MRLRVLILEAEDKTSPGWGLAGTHHDVAGADIVLGHQTNGDYIVIKDRWRIAYCTITGAALGGWINEGVRLYKETYGSKEKEGTNSSDTSAR